MSSSSNLNETPSPQVKPDRLEDWARRQPNKIALIEAGMEAGKTEAGKNVCRQITYEQWDQQANQLAYAMQRRGIGSDDIVAVRMQNRIAWAIIYAALAKLNAGLLGVNWRLTASEVQFILLDSGASAFFCDDNHPHLLAPAFKNVPLKLIAATEVDNETAVEESNVPIYPFAALFDSSDAPLFYSQVDARLIIYTSGTTGFPKGVVVNRAPRPDNAELIEYLNSVRGETFTDDEVLLVTMPMHHSAGPSIIRTGVNRGSTLIMMSRFDPETVLHLIDHYKVTTWNGVPTMYKRLAALPKNILDRYDVSSIKALSVGAAPVPYSLKEWIMDYFGEVLKEGYGSTEVGMVSSLPPALQKTKIGSSGKPFKRVQISIRDAEGCELPQGEVGEIWAYTPVAIRNYLNKEQLGEEVIDKSGFFRMGDMGRLDEDGFLYITDRTQDMIISGGVNIYPAEIEHVLIQHPEIQDVAVIGIPDEEFGEQVKAFVELKPQHSVTVENLMHFVKERIASYKQPKSIELVEELPRNTMGKLLKRELRDPYWKNRERNL